MVQSREILPYCSSTIKGLYDARETALSLFLRAAERFPQNPHIHYNGAVLSCAEVHDTSSRLAAFLRVKCKVGKGDRVCIYLQNIPQFVITAIASWKCGAVVVNANPMYKGDELAHILTDSGAKVLMAMDTLYDAVIIADRILERSPKLAHIITTSPYHYGNEFPTELFASVPRDVRLPPGVTDFQDALNRGSTCLTEACIGSADICPRSDDVCCLTYTSGTTGIAKGAINTHANMAYNAYSCQQWMELSQADVILGIAPLFHITGSTTAMITSFVCPTPLVLMYRFHPTICANTIHKHKATFTIAAITAFTAMLNDKSVTAQQLASLVKCYSGGAPISPSTIRNFHDRFGLWIQPIYGLTETAAQTHATPLRGAAPVDKATGACTVGMPMFDVKSYVVVQGERIAKAGEEGEIVISGPPVTPGYWGRPEETKKAIRTLDLDGTGPRDYLFTGDIAVADERGYFYIVDRAKDLIIVSGYKVWPREVEDVIYSHPDVNECAVVGVADSYRGETVKAFVSLKKGSNVAASHIHDLCKNKLAIFKVPKQIQILEDIPKTQTGKILRRQLRDQENSNPKARM